MMREPGEGEPSRRAVALTGAALLAALVVATAWASHRALLPGSHPVVDVHRDFTAADIGREVRYHDAVRPAAYASLALSLVVSGVLGLTRLGSRIVGRCGRRWGTQVAIGTVAITAIGRLITLPWSVVIEIARRNHGLSTRTWASFTSDVLIATGVTAATSVVVLLVVVALARWSPRRWWLWGLGTVAGLVAVGSFLYPVVVEPLFNRFDPLPAGPLRAELLALADRAGVPVEDILVSDASRRTTGANAYVSGLASTRRIVLTDTLLRQASTAEIEVVVAHELGHVQEDDVARGTLLGMVGGAAAVCVLALVVTARPVLTRAGASGPADPRVAPLLLFLVAVGTFVAAPAVNGGTRYVEARADLRALETTGDPDAFICSFKRLGRSNLGDLEPHPVSEWLFADHPSEPERIAFARAWADRVGLPTAAGTPDCELRTAAGRGA